MRPESRNTGIGTLLALALGLASCPVGAHAARSAIPSPGTVRFFKTATESFARYTADPTPAESRWMRSKYWRMLTYSPYFDTRLAWFPRAWVYGDLYAIYRSSAVTSVHPEWILRDAAGHKLFIPFSCNGGSCPQYSADIGAPAFRAFWIAQTAATLSKGYVGLFIDDVNMTLARVSDGTGRPVTPIDRRTGRQMTEADWRRYMAEFTQQIRAAFPGTELVHNALWFLGHDDPSVQGELLSADFISLERGVNDAGIRGGAGPFGFQTLLTYIDWVHAQGRSVVFDATAASDQAREYGLAVYLVAGAGRDALGNDSRSSPDDWWKGYDLSLGRALGPRYSWNGVIRRDFKRGIALVSEPDAKTRVLRLDGPYRDLADERRLEVTLDAAAGAILRRAAK